jgi:YD repeat-containing protein
MFPARAAKSAADGHSSRSRGASCPAAHFLARTPFDDAGLPVSSCSASHAQETTMVALVAGNSLGLNLTSLGTRGVAGNAALGRGTHRVTVNVANGNLVIQNQDDALAGPGLWSTSQRTYNSQEHLAGDHRLPGLQPPRLSSTGAIGQRNSSIVRKDADGGEDLYAYDANRALYLSTDGGGAYDTLRYRNNQLVWTDGDTGTAEYYARYQNQWQLVRRQDTDGNALAFLYNKDGQIQSVANNTGEVVYYDYSNRLLAQVRSVTVDANGKAQTVRVRYGYDSFERLSRVTVDLSPGDGSIADGRVYTTRYGYDDPSDRIVSIRESDGSSLAIAYVGSGNDVRVVSVTNALGETMRLAYDRINRRTTVTDALGLSTRYDCDAQGQLLRITGPAIAGGAQVQSFAYNARGDVLQVTDANGNVSAVEYDANGNQVLLRDAAGNVVSRSYDGQNQLLTETLYGAPDPDGAGVRTADHAHHLRRRQTQPCALYRQPGRPGHRVPLQRHRAAHRRVALCGGVSRQQHVGGIVSAAAAAHAAGHGRAGIGWRLHRHRADRSLAGGMGGGAGPGPGGAH